MLTPRNLIPLLTFTFAGLMASSCPVQYPIEQDRYFSPVLHPEDIPHQISRAQKLARFHPDKEVRAEAHLRLAMLNLDYRNPNPDYERSLNELELYISMSQDGDREEHARNLVHLITDYEAAREESEELRRDVEKLIKKNRFLRGENQRMEEAIKQLKYLDLQLEEKRRRIK